MTERLASLEGDHVLLSVLASEIKAGDLKISGHMVRRLVAPTKRMMGYLHWEVTMPGSDLVLGTHEFLDDGCARFVVLRRRGWDDLRTSAAWYPCCNSTGACTCPPEGA